MKLDELLERLHIGEDQDFECQLAENELPKSLWSTISAFANTNGGYIILGVKEKAGNLELQGVNNPSKLLKDFWNLHNNHEKLSFPICREPDVILEKINDIWIIIINIPKANRTQKPVYINNNPITGSYKRNYEGDYLRRQEEVAQMFRDASHDPQDLEILDGFDLKDLDQATLKAFRNRFYSRISDHPWLSYDDRELLRHLGGWKSDRANHKEGLTRAGLLMFGLERSILDAFPFYHLDYQEKLSEDPQEKWSYRITLDGQWEANLFNFYHRVSQHLVRDLNLPFKLDHNAVRIETTPIHQALREALVNTLIHADYLSTKPITIIKNKTGFSLANPGLLRISYEQLYKGGISDPRNPNLQKMFQMIGLGEKAGSGFEKILIAWKEQSWVIPLVSEDYDQQMTLINLPIVSLVPDHIRDEIKKIIGSNNYNTLTELDHLILVLAHQFSPITNRYIQLYLRSNQNPKEITTSLQGLVNNNWLQKKGQGRGTRYIFNWDHLDRNSDHLDQNSDHLDQNSDHLNQNSDHLESNSDYSILMAIADEARKKRKLSSDMMEQIILTLCRDRFLRLEDLGLILKRSVHTLRSHYITKMLKQGLLELQYPQNPNHPHQKYKTAQFPG